jgi:hypothetical protein
VSLISITSFVDDELSFATLGNPANAGPIAEAETRAAHSAAGGFAAQQYGVASRGPPITVAY